MKDVPMPYSAPMILAKLAGRKWKTRRVMIPQPPSNATHCIQTNDGGKNDGPGFLFMERGECQLSGTSGTVRHPNGSPFYANPPRGVVGDRHYWQEAFDFVFYDAAKHLMFFSYKADGLRECLKLDDREHELVSKWKQPADVSKPRGMPAMYMLKSMSRGGDVVTDLRAERVQDVTEEDALADGGWTYGNCPIHKAPIKSYAELWDTINSERGYRWQINPWVWVYGNERKSI